MDVLLSYKHLEEFKKYCTKEVIKQNQLGKEVFKDKNGNSIDQSQVSRRIDAGNVSYLDVSRLIKVLSDEGDDEDKIKPFRRILAERIVLEIFAELPEFNEHTFPFLRKINLSDMNSISRLKKYLAKNYLEDFEDLGLSENIITPDIENQPLAYFEGYISALVYLLWLIERILYKIIFGDKYYIKSFTININNRSMLLWFIDLMGAFNKMQLKTAAFNNTDSTEYDKEVFNEQCDINILGLFLSSQGELLHFCPSGQSKFFYAGWDSFCTLFLENLITKTDEDLLLYFRKNKYRLLDSLDYCLDKFMEKHVIHAYDFSKFIYDVLIFKLEIEGYKEAEKRLIQFERELDLGINWETSLMLEIEVGRTDDIKKDAENILLCFCNKIKGMKVASYLLFSKKQYKKSLSSFSPIDAWEKFTEIMEYMKEYFGTEEIAARQIKNFVVDAAHPLQVFDFIQDLQAAKSILYYYRDRNSRNRQGEQFVKIEAILNELTYGPNERNISDQLVYLSQKYGIRVDKLPSRHSFLKEFTELYGVYSWNETSHRLFEKYGLELDDILYFMKHYPYRDGILNFLEGHFLKEDVKLKEKRLANKTPPKSFAEINKFKDRKEFCDFIQSWEIIDYFSDFCEETDAEFLRLFLKVNEKIWTWKPKPL